MKICFMCDLHLPSDRRALQYDVLEWVIDDLLNKRPDCIVFAGDATCDGNENSYEYVVRAFDRLQIPFLYIPGNSDLRSKVTREAIRRKASPCKNMIKGETVFAVNDCDGTISADTLACMETAEDDGIVFMHHPLTNHHPIYVEQLLAWRERHPKTTVVYGHLHRFVCEENSMSLPALDPDKSIGEAPCVIYYDTKTKAICKSHYAISVPNGISEHFGISCYKPLEQVEFATKHRLKALELRPNCVDVDRKELIDRVQRWRMAGGERLSVHLSDVGYSDGAVTFDDRYDELLALVERLRADRITQHVPKVGVKDVESDPKILVEICEFLTDRFNRISHNVTIGVENMHMTSKETPDGNRRFGYTPEECLQWMRLLATGCSHRVGINFDIGHARNNAPYSQTYPIGMWFAMLGKDIVGYHMHQVTHEDGVFRNHMPITDIYGSLISLASFLKYWETGRINHAPIIFEMRPEDAYEMTLKMFGICLERADTMKINGSLFY